MNQSGEHAEWAATTVIVSNVVTVVVTVTAVVITATVSSMLVEMIDLVEVIGVFLVAR